MNAGGKRCYRSSINLCLRESFKSAQTWKLHSTDVPSNFANNKIMKTIMAYGSGHLADTISRVESYSKSL